MIDLITFRSKLNTLIGDVTSGKTTDNGDADGTTAIDSLLLRFPDDYFKDYVFYLPSVPASQIIRSSSSIDGKLTFYNPFASQVANDTSYEIHRFSLEDKKLAINKALLDAYPYFFKLVTDTTLLGKGSLDTEYNVPTTLGDYSPKEIWIKHVSDKQIYHERVLTVDYKDVKKFYAVIPKDKTILLIAEIPLSQFTNDASETELTSPQADIVCLKSASNLYQMFVNKVDSQDAARFEALIARFEIQWEGLKRVRAMKSHTTVEVDWSWAK